MELKYKFIFAFTTSLLTTSSLFAMTDEDGPNTPSITLHPTPSFETVVEPNKSMSSSRTSLSSSTTSDDLSRSTTLGNSTASTNLSSSTTSTNPNDLSSSTGSDASTNVPLRAPIKW